MIKNHTCAFVVIAVLALGACGSDGGEVGSDGTSAAQPTDVGTDQPEAEPTGDDVQASVDDLAENLETAQNAVGGGSATFTANGQTWEFPNVLCAFGEDEIGQPGAVFNLSAIADGLQLYASIDDSGATHSLSLNDIKDFENPTVGLSMNSFVTSFVGASEQFLSLDGKQVSADIKMLDDTSDEPIPPPTADNAQLTATCP